MTGPTCKKIVHPAYTEKYYDPSVGFSVFSLGISAMAGCNQSTKKIPERTEWIETESNENLQLDNNIEHVRAEKTCGDGMYQNLKIVDNGKKASIKLVATGPNILEVTVYTITNESSNGPENLRETVTDIVSKNLVHRVNKGDEYRTPEAVEELSMKALNNHLETEYNE